MVDGYDWLVPDLANLIKFNEKIELGLPFPRVPRRRDITCRMIMTLPIAPTLFSRWQCVVDDRLKRTRVHFILSTQKFTKLLLQLADSADNNISMDYNIQIITKDDKLRVLKFLRRFFFRDEPLNYAIQLIPESEDSTCLELEEYCSMSSIENNLSLMAVSTSGAIVGVILNGKMGPSSDQEPEYITTCKNPKFKKILRLLYRVDKDVNRDGKFQGQNILEVRIISVDSNWRGKGIAKTLVEKTIEIAKEKGFHIVRVDCSSFFSGKLCARLNFEQIYELKYADYVDEDGNPIFSPAYPHTSVTTYIKKL